MAHRLNDAPPVLNDLIKKSTKLSLDQPERYRLLATRSNLDIDGEIRKWTFGQKHANMQNKTVLMVGETGTGKTTLINTMVNYHLGVKFEDKVWFEITEEDQQDQTESKTSEVTAYEIISEEKPFSLTIIDTPGFGDTRGIDQDEKIAQNLHKLFLHKTSGVKDLDAVCLVLKASQNRISEAQRYIFEGVLSLFGKDIKDIIGLFITHSDGGAPTNVLEAVKKEKIPCCQDDENKPIHFLFNNQQLKKSLTTLFYNAYWEMGETSLEKFFTFLETRQRKSVGLTVSVLQERIQVEACVQNLKERIKFREEKEKELTQVQDALKMNKENIEKDENFPFTVTILYKEKVNVAGASWWDQKVTSCKTCEENCHELGCWFTQNVRTCEVMTGGHCTMCKCHYSDHIREGRKYVTKTKEETVTFKDLKNKYSNEDEGGVSYDKNALKDKTEELNKTLKLKEEMTTLESDLKKDLEENNEKKKCLVKEAYEAFIKLPEIALKPDSVFTLQYLDFLIPRVEEAGEAEWAQRLKRMQTEAEKESTKSVMSYLGWMRSKTGL